MSLTPSSVTWMSRLCSSWRCCMRQTRLALGTVKPSAASQTPTAMQTMITGTGNAGETCSKMCQQCSIGHIFDVDVGNRMHADLQLSMELPTGLSLIRIAVHQISSFLWHNCQRRSSKKKAASLALSLNCCTQGKLRHCLPVSELIAMADTNASLGISTLPNICRQSRVHQAEVNRQSGSTSAEPTTLRRRLEWGQAHTGTVSGRAGVKDSCNK